MRSAVARKALLKAGFSLCLVIWHGHANAQSVSTPDVADVEAITVTARKTREPLIASPVSISVLTAGDLANPRLRDFSGLPSQLPNVAMSGGIAGALQGQIAVRGIATLVRNIGVESGVGVYVDGVYIGRPDSYNQALLDIERVELLRGPQGALYGKNTIAGVFNMISKAPTDALSANARVDAGEYSLFRVQAALSGPVVEDTVRGRIAFGYARHDGLDHHLSGGRAASSDDEFSWRGALAFDASDRLTVTLRTDGLTDRAVPGFYSATDIGQPGFVLLPGLPRGQIDNNRPDHLSRDIAGGSVTAVLSLGASELTSISAYRSSRYHASLDDDQRQVDLLSADLFSDRTEIWSQELRLNSRLNERLTYVAGLYYLDQTTRTDRVLAAGAGFGVPGDPRLTTRGRVKTTSYAAFASADWRLLPALTLSVGARYTHERKRVQFVQDDETGVFTFLGLPDISFGGSSDDDDVSPTVSLSYAVATTVHLYGRIARGFKSAAFNVDLAASPRGLIAGPEKATTYEAGLKATAGAGHVDVRLAAFHTDYNDLQVAQITGGGTVLGNAGKARVDGFEAELAVMPLTGLRLEGSLGYADARYARFDNCAVPLSEGGGAADCAGKRLTGAPEFTAYGAATYGTALSFGRLTGRVAASHQSSVYFEPTNSDRFRGRGRTLVDVRVTLELDGWSVSGWVQNLTDETYETYRDDRTLLGVLRTTAYGPQRSFGGTVAVQL